MLSTWWAHELHIPCTWWAHVLHRLSTWWAHVLHMLSTCTPALSNLYPWFDYISWKHGRPETTASYPTSQRQSPRTYTLQANMNWNNKHKGIFKMMRWTSRSENPAITRVDCMQGATGCSWEAWVAPAEASGPGFDCKQLVTFHSPLICLVTLKYLSSKSDL